MTSITIEMLEKLKDLCGGGQAAKTPVSKTGNGGFDSPTPHWDKGVLEYPTHFKMRLSNYFTGLKNLKMAIS